MLAAAVLLAPGHAAEADPPAPVQAAGHDSIATAHGRVGLSYMVAAGKSNKDDEALAILQLGAHEPRRDGIPLHLVTLSGEVALRPRLAGYASAMARSTSGERGEVEVEEAYLTVGADDGVQLRIGRFFTEVGRLNAQHVEDAHFVDKPVIHARLFGPDQLSNEGLRLRAPIARSRVTIGVQGAKGETASSFLAESGEELGGYPLPDRDADEPKDWIYHVNCDAPLSPAARAGVFAVHGPNASGRKTRTTIYGADITFAQRADETDETAPVVSWHTEILYRRYEAGDAGDPARDTLIDKGLVTQALWAFRSRWVAGWRLDYATGNGERDPTGARDRRSRHALALTWQARRHARVRLQANRDSAHHLASPARSVWLQLRFAAGGEADHGASREPSH